MFGITRSHLIMVLIGTTVITAVAITVSYFMRWRETDSVTFSTPQSFVRLQGGVKQEKEGDSVTLVIPPPSEGGGVVPEWSVNISDRSGFIERKNHLSWYLPLMWKNNHLMLEPGTTEPAFSYSIFGGRVRVRYLVVEEASNSMAIQTDLIYVSNGRNPVEAAKSIIINVKIEPKQ